MKKHSLLSHWQDQVLSETTQILQDDSINPLILTWLGCLCLLQAAIPLVLGLAVLASSQGLACNTAQSIWARQLQEGPSLLLQCGW